MLWCIHCEDKPDSLELRKATRPSHLEYLADFEVVAGGPLLDEGGNPAGSVIIVEAADRAAAQTFSDNDPYAQAGLFDRVAVHEFKKVMWPGDAD